MGDMTMQPNTSLEPTGVGAGSSAARFTSRVAGGSVLGRLATGVTLDWLQLDEFGSSDYDEYVAAS